MQITKRAIRIINHAEYLDHTNSLFFKSQTLKFMDLVKLRMETIMFKAQNDAHQKIFKKGSKTEKTSLKRNSKVKAVLCLYNS